VRRMQTPQGVATNGAAPVQQSAAPPTQRRSRREALWVLVLLATALVGYAIVQGGRSPGIPVLVTTRALQAGDTIKSSDLTTSAVKASGAATIPGSRLSSVVGERAAGPLAAGTILSPSSVSSAPAVGPGQAGIALALTPDQAAQGILAAGQSVVILGQVSSAGSSSATPMAAQAVVLSVSPGPANSGKVLVDLVLANPAQASAVSAAVATPQGVRLVVLPGGANG
jgi:pilus assembly protein CpaB